MSYTPYPDNTWAYNYPVRSNNVYATLGGNSYAPAAYPDGSIATFQRGFPAPQPVVIPSNGIISNPDPTSQYYIIPLDYKNPAVVQWNFAVQRSLPGNLVLDVAYVGNHGVRTPSQVNLNAGEIIGAGDKGRPQYPRTAASTLSFQGFSSLYNALQMKLDRRFSRGFSLTTSFTYSKAMDFQTGDDGGLLFYVDLRRNYARADFDRTFSYVQSFLYELPFGRGKQFATSGFLSKVFGGWQTGGIMNLRSGTPFNVTVNNNVNAPGSSDTVDVVGPISFPKGINNGNEWFSRSAFATPPSSRFGNLGRNVLTGPGLFRLDANLIRHFRVREGWDLQVRADSLNVTNTPQFGNPSANISTQNTFGYVTSTLSSGTGVNGTGGGRVITGGLKFTF